MISASPLVKNDPRLPVLIARLRAGANLTSLSRELGYSDHVQFRYALKDMIGQQAYTELMSGRVKLFSKMIPEEYRK
jgi:hypothetical protein